MTDLRAAAQQALEALWFANARLWFGDKTIKKAIDDLQSELAQQEPCCGNKASGTSCLADPRQSCPMFTHPPRREWQGLTEEEINRVEDQCWSHDGLGAKFIRADFARAVEAALRSKNYG